jgi:uncharacterized SAM-binding protein YcdF (DUF218 family)
MIVRAVLAVVAGMLALVLLASAGGVMLFTNAPTEPLQRADAVVVLGGEHDGREDYGLALARSGWAPTVVISNPYPSSDPIMRRVCTQSDGSVEVICMTPFPLTTRGEAELVRRLGIQRAWSKIIVVTWKYHVPRARLIFWQCFSQNWDTVIMRAVPRRYDFSPLRWESIYAYQYGGFLKAFAQGDCN